jgi:serine/threonine protein kinase
MKESLIFSCEFSKYVLDKFVGRGAFSKVYKAKNIKNEDEIVAIKVIDNDQINNNEIQNLRLLKSPYIVEFVDFSISWKNKLVLVMEFCVVNKAFRFLYFLK